MAYKGGNDNPTSTITYSMEDRLYCISANDCNVYDSQSILMKAKFLDASNNIVLEKDFNFKFKLEELKEVDIAYFSGDIPESINIDKSQDWSDIMLKAVDLEMPMDIVNCDEVSTHDNCHDIEWFISPNPGVEDKFIEIGGERRWQFEPGETFFTHIGDKTGIILQENNFGEVDGGTYTIYVQLTKRTKKGDDYVQISRGVAEQKLRIINGQNESDVEMLNPATSIIAGEPFLFEFRVDSPVEIDSVKFVVSKCNLINKNKIFDDDSFDYDENEEGNLNNLEQISLDEEINCQVEEIFQGEG